MEDFKKEIDKVLKGELTSTSSNILVSPSEIDTYLKNEGLIQGDFDSNGWDWDFWMEYLSKDNRYILSGSGWYNTGLTFYLDNENE